MSSLDDLPPDQRAALSVLLRQRKSYGQLAGMLGISEHALHDRAHAALAVLAPREARGLDPATRAEIGDYLLGQAPGVGERMRTRTLLSTNPAAGAWARALAAKLAPLAPDGLPEIPASEAAAGAPAPPAPAAAPAAPVAAPAPAAAPAAAPASPAPSAAPAAGASAPVPPAAQAPPPSQGPYPLSQAAQAGPGPAPERPVSSRRGGAILLGVIVAVVVVAVILISSKGSSNDNGKTGTGAKTSSTSSTATGPKTEGRFTLHSPDPHSRSTGTVEILSEDGKRAFYIQAEHIPATDHFFYAIWLYNSPTSALPLSKSPPVGKTHKLAGAALLPASAGDYKEILLTRETSTRPTHPGHVVLRGAFSLSG